MRRARRPMLARLTAVALLASLLAIVGSSTASATTTVWTNPVQLTGMAKASGILTRPNGDVMIGCTDGAASSGLRTVTASGGDGGSIARTTSGQTIQACDGISAVSSNGTVYAPVASTPNPYATWIQRYDLVANQGSTRLWATELSTTCGNIWNFPSSVVMGNDGNVYIVAGSGGQCSTGTRLIGFNATTGATLFNVALGTSGSGRYNGLLPYASGLVVWWGSQFRYFNYSGSEQTPVNITLSSGESVADVAGGTGGNVFAMVVKNQSPNGNCPYGQVASRVLAFNGSGQAWQHSILDCQQYRNFRSTPSNGVVFGGTSATGVEQLTGIKNNGSPTWASPYLPDSGDDGTHVFNASRRFNTFVDNNGNVLVLRWYSSNGGQRQGAQISIVDGATGYRRAVIYTSDLDASKSFNVPATGIGTSAGRLYVVATTCTSGTCSSGDPYLYAVQVPILGMDFPRAAALGQTPQPPAAELKYVALGDSFSSGEGVAPFDSSTDVPSGSAKNLCHRSLHGYARQLDRDPAANLRLASFVACSGATTEQITGVWPAAGGANLNEAPQYQALSADDDVVTITIGGNDVGFSNVVAGCVIQLCELQIDAAYDRITPDDVGVKLYLAYHKIRQHVGPNTKVLVIGYPSLVPESGDIDQGCQLGPPMTSISPSQLVALRELGDALNHMIEVQAEKPDIGFTYVPNHAFSGHELCTADPYVNRVQLTGDTEYSMHPNLKGQEALRRLIVEALDS